MGIDINALSGGALSEKVNIEMRKVAENVLDPNTKADAVRTLTVTIKIKPNEQRQIGNADIQVKSTLAPAMGIPTSFVFDFDKEGKAVAKELFAGPDRNQLAMSDDGNVVDGSGDQLGNVVNGKFR